MRNQFLIATLCSFFSCTLAFSRSTEPNCQNQFLLGASKSDITGPVYGLGMMGYALPYQKTFGIHMRLWSRAFVVASQCSDKKRVVFVSADLGQIFQAVRLSVLKKLKLKFGDLYTQDNVLLSATHTHSGPGGYSYDRLYNLSIGGFSKQNFNTIVDGIFESISQAHENAKAGTLSLSVGDLSGVGFNRSLLAYLKNPLEERQNYTTPFDTTMTQIMMTDEGHQPIGLINWFALHGTNIGNTHGMISPDNKGIASQLFESQVKKNFIAAFSQSNEGDVSPNIWGYPDHDHDFERATINGRKQYEKSREILNNSNQLVGEVDYRQVYIDLTHYEMLEGHEKVRLCSPAIGASMLGGTTSDGLGLPFMIKGLRFGSGLFRFTLMPETQKCQGDKPIVVPLNILPGEPWVPKVLPFQIVRIASLALIAVPFECTTMCGRRLRKIVLDVLKPIGVERAVIAGLSNSYAGYLTTKEEYALQHYEGASNLFGPKTLEVVGKIFSDLALSMKNGTRSDSSPLPLSRQKEEILPSISERKDMLPFNTNYGQVVEEPKQIYKQNEEVDVLFWSANPNHNLYLNKSYFAVEKLAGGSWDVVATDDNLETTIQWVRRYLVSFQARIAWKIPAEREPGQYRIRYFGFAKLSFFDNKLTPYTGIARTFEIAKK